MRPNALVLMLGAIFLLLILTVVVVVSRDKGWSSTSSSPPQAASPQLPQPQAAVAPDGEQLFAQHCSGCHQATGQGVPGVFPPLAGAPVPNGPPDYFARLILYGLQGEITVAGQPYDGVMPSFASTLDDAQIASVMSYIRSAWGNRGEAVTPKLVAHERAKPGDAQDNYAHYPK